MNTNFSKPGSYFFWGIIISLTGAICFSTKAILVKLAYQHTDIDALSLLALRMLFALPFFLVYGIVSSRKSSNVKFTGKQWVYIAIIGCLGYYVSSLLDFIGLQYVSAGIERLILFIYPTMVALISAIAFKIKIKKTQWIALIITYIGVAIAFADEIEFQSHDNQVYFGSLLIFICAFTYALYIVGSSRLIPVVGSSKFNSYAMSFAAIGALIHFSVQHENSFLNFAGEVYWYGLTMAILSTVIPSYLLSNGIKRIGANNAAIVGSIGPVSTIIQAYFFLGETMTLLQLFGTALILSGILFITWKPQAID